MRCLAAGAARQLASSKIVQSLFNTSNPSIAIVLSLPSSPPKVERTVNPWLRNRISSLDYGYF